jgi:integrase
MVPVISAHLEKFTDKRPDGWLFPGANRTQADGPPIHQSSFFKAWNRARKTAGIPEFRFHDLRHHAASHLAAAGLTDVEVMRILGQRSGEAFRRYLDRIRGRELAAIETATARSGLVAGKAES